jgi:hypothetical protein
MHILCIAILENGLCQWRTWTGVGIIQKQVAHLETIIIVWCVQCEWHANNMCWLLLHITLLLSSVCYWLDDLLEIHTTHRILPCAIPTQHKLCIYQCWLHGFFSSFPIYTFVHVYSNLVHKAIAYFESFGTSGLCYGSYYEYVKQNLIFYYVHILLNWWCAI